MEDGQEPQGTGEPVTERARIAGVEAGIAAGLVPSTEAVARPAIRAGRGPLPRRRAPTQAPQAPGATVSGRVLASYELPDWTDPPTLQVPRVLLDLEQEAALERGGPLPTPPGGPVWRERQEDWNDSDAVLADLANAGLSVTASRSRPPTTPSPTTSSTTTARLPGSPATTVPDAAPQPPRSADALPPVAEADAASGR